MDSKAERTRNLDRYNAELERKTKAGLPETYRYQFEPYHPVPALPTRPGALDYRGLPSVGLGGSTAQVIDGALKTCLNAGPGGLRPHAA